MNTFQPFDVKTLTDSSPFTLIGDQWALLSAGVPGAYNTMTVSWGQLGVLWNKNVATVYVRPQRHTLSFLEQNDTFTLSFFKEQYRPALALCGSKSGRDLDKAKAANLTPVFDEGSVWFDEAQLVLVCRKLYRQPMLPECFLDKAVDEKNYNGDYHICFIGEIIKALRAQEACGAGRLSLLFYAYHTNHKRRRTENSPSVRRRFVLHLP